MDPLAPPTGDVSPFLTNFSTVKESLSILRNVRQSHRGKLEAQRNIEPLNPTCRVWVKNNTGGTLLPLSVVKLGDPVISAVDYTHTVRESPVFYAETPAASTDAFAIIEDGISGSETEKLSRAVVLGVVPCYVNVTNASHNYAEPAASTTASLASATSGPARILWKETGTGTKRAVVLLDRGGSTLTWDMADLESNFDITNATDTRQDTGLSVSIPSSGDYWVFGTVNGLHNIASGGGAFLVAELYDTNAAGVIFNASARFCGQTTTSTNMYDSASLGCVYTFAAASTMKLYATRSGLTWNTSRILGNAAPSITNIGYMKLS